MNKSELIMTNFPSLEKALVDEIDKESVIKELITGNELIGDGDYIKTFPMVLKGSLRVMRISDDGDELLLYYLNQGEICSMSLSCCMMLQKSKICMIAEEDSLVLVIPVQKPEKWISEFSSWKELMMNSYRQRYDQLLETVDSIAFMELDNRLIRFFEERYASTGQSVFKGTHQNIAFQLNTSREVVSRLLKNLEKNGLVITERNSVDYSKLIVR
jgi:CRP/FNR family transcriptional regulator, anaerobic regulatory protein